MHRLVQLVRRILFFFCIYGACSGLFGVQGRSFHVGDALPKLPFIASRLVLAIVVNPLGSAMHKSSCPGCAANKIRKLLSRIEKLREPFWGISSRLHDREHFQSARGNPVQFSVMPSTMLF